MLTILKTTIEYLESPIGIDNKKPRFSWLIDSDKTNVLQTVYKIRVFNHNEEVWNSGEIYSKQSVDILYNGEALLPTTEYRYQITVKDNYGETASKEGSFETGLMDTSLQAWNGARWIGQKTPSLSAHAKGVFAIEAKFKISGNKAGIIFGAQDERLLSKYKNIMGVEGENRISYEIDISQIPAQLIIHRIGYAKEDVKEKPLFSGFIVDINDKDNIPITHENKNDWHILRVEVYGNVAKAFVDEICVDGVWKNLPFLQNSPILLEGRQLNPLAENDTITFPRLNKIGFTIPCGRVEFEYLKVCDIREPQATLYRLDAENNIFPQLVDSSNLLKIDGTLQEILLVDPSNGSIPIFRNEFITRKEIKRARLYITSRGIYDAVINGKNVSGDLEDYPSIDKIIGRSNQMLLPGASQFDKHLFYNVYDITNKLYADNTNAIAVMLASGWWSDSQTFTLMNHNFFGDKPSFMAQIIVEYKNGEKEIIVTNTKNWKLFQEGPITFSGYFAGESYDATKEENISGYDLPNFNDKDWILPTEISITKILKKPGFAMWPIPNQTEPELINHIGEQVKIIEVLESISMLEIRPNIFLYDMGQNMVGVPYIKIKGQKGQKIWLRYGEMTYPYLDEYGELQGTLLTENLRDAESNDFYICKGDKNGEIIFPKFTFHGYRYVEITGLAKAPLMTDVKGIVISSFTKQKGNFKTDNNQINRLYENILWSQRANFISIPTDCPQRNERMGWMGDAQVFASTAAYNDDVRSFFERYLISVRDLQNENGQFPCIAPVGGGFGGIAWESAGIIIPWVIYQHYGECKILEDNFNAMMKYGCYLETKIKNGLLMFDTKEFGNLGDWLATDLSTDGPLIWNAIAIYDMEILSRISKILGKNKEEEKFSALYHTLKENFNHTFFDSSIGKSKALDGNINDTQCSYALPLSYGIYTKDNEKMAAKRLDEKTKELDYTLTTGFIGTPCIAPALSNNGYAETAYKLLCQNKYPSWLYPITQGATTIWERWNSYTVENGFGGNNAMNSFNHYSLGAVGFWLYSSVLGIKNDGAGYQNIILKPEFNSSFGKVEGYYCSEYGKIESDWEYKNSVFLWNVKIPVNTSATLILPKGIITVNGNSITAQEITETNNQKFLLGSGKYRITLCCK